MFQYVVGLLQFGILATPGIFDALRRFVSRFRLQLQVMSELALAVLVVLWICVETLGTQRGNFLWQFGVISHSPS